MTRILYSPSRFKRKKRKLAFWSLILLKIILPSFFIFGGVFYFLFFSPYFQIKEIKILGLETIPESTLKAKIDETISRKIYFFASQGNIFLFPSKKIKTLFLKEFPKIKEISVERSLPDFIKIKIKEREMAAIWCNIPQNLSDCFFVDKEGVIFENAPSGGGSLIFKINNNLPRADIELGERVFEADFGNRLFNIKEILEKNFDINFPEFTILDSNVLEAKSSLGWKIIFDPSLNNETQILALKKIFSEMGEKERETLEYFDLRIGGRIYYK